MKRILALLGISFLIFTAPALAQNVEVETVSDLTGGDTGSLDGPFSWPRPTWLDPLEGGGDPLAPGSGSGGAAGVSGLMTRINSRTFVVLSPGADREWGTSDDGAVHCFNVGLATQDCEFIELGFLPPGVDCCTQSFLDTDGNGFANNVTIFTQEDQRAPIRVNNSTALVIGGGELDSAFGNGNAVNHATLCEDGGAVRDNGTNLFGGPIIANDTLFILRGLGAAGATVDEINNLCLGTFASDPIRVNDNTIIFAQPGADGNYEDSNLCGDFDLDDEIWVVRDLSPARKALFDPDTSVTVLNVGEDLEVFMSGAPAARAVRVSNNVAVFASPGPDGEFSDTDDCGLLGGDVEGDGLIVVKGLALATGTPTTSYVPLGDPDLMSANPDSRPVKVNEVNGVVVLPGTGDDQEYDPDNADNKIFVVRNLVAGTPAVTVFDSGDAPSGIASMQRALAPNSTTALFFDVNEEEGDSDSRLYIHIIGGIGGTAPTIKTIRVPGSVFGKPDSERTNTGVVMNARQVIFDVYGKNQAMALTLGPRPKLGAAGGAVDDWTATRIVRVAPTVAAYVVAKQGALGLLRLETTGGLEDIRLMLGGKKGPGGQPVALNQSKVAYNVFSNGAILVAENVTRRPIFELIQTKEGIEDQHCAAPGCRPIVMGTAAAPVLVMIAPGDNGQLDARDDESDDDDEIIFISDL